MILVILKNTVWREAEKGAAVLRSKSGIRV